jgi:hypothetical protein
MRIAAARGRRIFLRTRLHERQSDFAGTPSPDLQSPVVMSAASMIAQVIGRP